MKSIRTQDAVGHALIHDLVRIVIGEVKDTPFRRGHVITEEDIPKLLDLGKEHIFVMEPEDEGFLHEEDVARALYDMAGGENPVSAALVNLAGFFRNTLSFSGYLITVDEEIRYTKDYIKILHLRYADLFSVKWDIDDAILPCKVIKTCLQPIIENAVYHGFKPKGGNGLLTVTGKLSDNNIVFTLSDDGVGMSPDEVSTLNESLNTNVYTNISPHIGLANVNKRIKIIFGENYGLSVKSSEGCGTDVRITIPASQ